MIDQKPVVSSAKRSVKATKNVSSVEKRAISLKTVLKIPKVQSHRILLKHATVVDV
jgi:hypothetical protein